MSLSAIIYARSLRVVTVPMTHSLQSVMRLMRAECVDAVPVIDHCATEGEVVLGLITRRAVCDALADHGPAALTMKVADLLEDGMVFCDVREALAVFGHADARPRGAPCRGDGSRTGDRRNQCFRHSFLHRHGCRAEATGRLR